MKQRPKKDLPTGKYNKQQLKERIDMAMSAFFKAGKQVQRHRDTALQDVQPRPIEMSE